VDDWVFHIKVSYGSDGLLEVWRDGGRVVSHQGPNCYNDQGGPFLKVGLCKPYWKNRSVADPIEQRAINIDEFKVGDQAAMRVLRLKHAANR